MTTYVAALTDGGGSVPPELGAVRRLVQRGHRVTVLGEDSIAAEVAPTGADFRPWRHALNRPDRRPEHAPYQEWAITDPRQRLAHMIEHLIVRPAPGYAYDLNAAIRDLQPDRVLTSFFAFGAMIAAESAGRPFDVLMPNIYPLPAPGMPPFGLGFAPARGALGRLRDRVVGTLGQRMWDRHALPGLNTLRAQHGLAPLAHWQDQVHRARRQLVMTSRSFDFPAAVPAQARYVGPVLDEPAWALDTQWTPPPGKDPLVLVAMSSTYQDQRDCLQRIVDALASMAVRAVVTTGPALDPAQLRAAPNVTVCSAAPHHAVMAQAALVVTHGGHGTLMKAFAAGLPVVVLHHGRDQADNAARVTWHGAGLAVPRQARPAPHHSRRTPRPR